MDLPVYQTLLLQKHDAHILVVTLNRPQALNALNTQMGRDQIDLWTRLTAEPGEPRCVVLTGAGERAFCAGADLKERDGMTESVRAQHEIFERAFMAPGAAAAGDRRGSPRRRSRWLLACDFIYAARNARMALSETRLGLMPGGAGTQNLARAAGERRAKELVMTAQPFDAQQGYEWGIVNRVCDNALDEAIATARTISDNAPLAVRQAKKSVHYGLQMDLLTGYRFEIEAYNQLVGTEDRKEGVRAFNEKRKPKFQGR